MRVFVTVGTTKFQKLIDSMTNKDVVEALLHLGIDFVQIQTGRDFKEVKLSPNLEAEAVYKENDSTIVKVNSKLTLKYDNYFENFEEQIKHADLVISHAGAGSCLDVLRQNKPLIVVINEDLMDNHQTELAEQLQKNGHLYYCICETLVDTLHKDLSKLRTYPKPDNTLFSSHLDKYCGFVE